ncbi:MAG TPA: DNA translocase FtsK 4TM domain-containing protein, partial [Solirubrobacteraceae bacterium]
MATTKSRRRPPARARSSRPARRGGAKKSAKRPSALRTAARTQLHGHGIDAVALGLLALGALSGLALATDLAGPLGHALSSGITAVLGNGAFLVPLGLVATAGLMLWRRPDEEGAAPLRIGIGVVLIVLSVAGLLHVVGGAPNLSDPVDSLRNAGGYVGAGVGVPLTAGVGPAGASIVLLAFLALGLLLASGLSLPRVIELAGT